MSYPISIVLFSGTDDKLHAAATIVAGAAALDRPVNVLLQFWALDAFRADHAGVGRGLAFEALRPGQQPPAKPGALPWAETFRQAKELGEVRIRACSASMAYLDLEPAQLDPMVDDVCGIAAFLLDADTGPVVFI